MQNALTVLAMAIVRMFLRFEVLWLACPLVC